MTKIEEKEQVAFAFPVRIEKEDVSQKHFTGGLVHCDGPYAEIILWNDIRNPEEVIRANSGTEAFIVRRIITETQDVYQLQDKIIETNTGEMKKYWLTWKDGAWMNQKMVIRREPTLEKICWIDVERIIMRRQGIVDGNFLLDGKEKINLPESGGTIITLNKETGKYQKFGIERHIVFWGRTNTNVAKNVGKAMVISAGNEEKKMIEDLKKDQKPEDTLMYV